MKTLRNLKSQILSICLATTLGISGTALAAAAHTPAGDGAGWIADLCQAEDDSIRSNYDCCYAKCLTWWYQGPPLNPHHTCLISCVDKIGL